MGPKSMSMSTSMLSFSMVVRAEQVRPCLRWRGGDEERASIEGQNPSRWQESLSTLTSQVQISTEGGDEDADKGKGEDDDDEGKCECGLRNYQPEEKRNRTRVSERLRAGRSSCCVQNVFEIQHLQTKV